MDDKYRLGKRIKIVLVTVLIAAFIIIVSRLLKQNIRSVEDFQRYISGFGPAAALVLTLLQTIQVIVPVVPGYLGCAAGAIAFGAPIGFLCNYIGISLGSIAAYFIARKYGIDVVLTMFSEKQYHNPRQAVVYPCIQHCIRSHKVTGVFY